ncbi:SDR family oxidoreductase [Plantactinospora mayteni]|uniref:Short-chain dehydrogenase/reductase n=1 Tax=Plantactinospora mayteni TaxID=566021 RepID=A0ABQ4EFW5_9ACTN|nr:SDR family NAD(P)-dependent oxidoreductase [Plantactinospora mayteni]GIG93627.1 short-chain dehydrogenase/reductase [Plantactinospora mayteni]
MTDDQCPAVLVTGAGGGIGSAVVRLLAEQGHRVYAGVRDDRGQPPGPVARPSGGAGVRTVVLDVTDPDSVAEAARLVARETRGLRAVVNNAGVIVQGPLELVPAEELHRQFAVNTFGPVYVSQAFLPLLRAGNGRLVNVSAPTARVRMPFLAPISASKAALEALSDSLRIELATWRIPVVLVVPGSTATSIFAKADTAARAALALADPARVALYDGPLAAVADAMARQKLESVDPVARAILQAVRANRPRRRYVVGSGARTMGLLAHLPAGLRDRLVAGALGLRGPAPAAPVSGPAAR